MTDLNLDMIARDMQAAQDQAAQLPPFTGRFPDFDLPAAYAVARKVHETRIAKGARPVGRKIGFTNAQMWETLGVREPMWGRMYEHTVERCPDGQASCSLGALVQPRIEPEIIVHFHKAPPVTNDGERILACIDWLASGFEIVQSHFPDWNFRAPDTIADGGLHGRLFIGPERRVEDLGPDLPARLEAFSIALSRNASLVECGRGANVLGSPLRAVAHLISVLATPPDAPPVAAGELVTTGTLTRAQPVLAGETWTSAIEGLPLPAMTLRFEA